jgi:hypothetical protein
VERCGGWRSNRRFAGEVYKNRAAAIVSNDVASRELTRLNGYCLAPAPIDSAILVCALFPQRWGHDSRSVEPVATSSEGVPGRNPRLPRGSHLLLRPSGRYEVGER